MRIDKIIVHNGAFHADDIMAICMVRKDAGYDIPVERKNDVLLSELDNPHVWVIDVGGVYAPDYHNFDHHQDITLPSACVLVGEYLYNEKYMGIIGKYLLNTISDVDTGKKMSEVGSINSIVRSFNSFPNGFNRALHVCTEIFDVYHATAIKSIEDTHEWDSLSKYGDYAIQYTTNEIIGWRELALRDGVNFLICPSARVEGQWNVISRDSVKFNIPANDKQLFRHANGFIAVYGSIEDAINSI